MASELPRPHSPPIATPKSALRIKKTVRLGEKAAAAPMTE